MERRIIVLDAQGGGVGKAVVRLIKERAPQAFVLAVGANAMATAAMLKAGADAGATGENAVVHNCSGADSVLIAPIGFLLANSMYGEVSPAMAAALSASTARRVLIPFRHGSLHIAGAGETPLAELIDDAVSAALRP